MKEYDPKNGTYKNTEIDPETKEIRYGECNSKEEKIFYKFQKVKQWRLYSKWWFWVICAIVLIAPWGVVIAVHLLDTKEKSLNQEQIQQVAEKVKEVVIEDKLSENAETITIMDSSFVGDAYTEIVDTMFQERQLRIYKVHYGIPELYVCDSTDIDINDSNIIFAARAADFDKGAGHSILGLFINKGEILATGSEHKEGFCAIIEGNITLGVAQSTPFFEQVIDKSGYFFRNAPLIFNGVACQYEGEHNQSTTRRALCAYHNEIVFITAENTTMTEFINILYNFGVQNAIYMVGSRGGNGFCRDSEGKLYTWGVSRYSNYKNVNYLIWKKK